MLELLASGWLAALGALALPLALHLFGRGHQRRAALGSVVHLRAAPTRRGRRLRPSDWPLLLLRCAFLAVLALALALPAAALAAQPPVLEGKPASDFWKTFTLAKPEEAPRG